MQGVHRKVSQYVINPLYIVEHSHDVVFEALSGLVQIMFMWLYVVLRNYSMEENGAG